VASVVEGGTRRGLVFDVTANAFVSQDGSTRSDATVRALAKVAGQEVTYTCTPPGTGRRVAFDS